MESFLLLKKNSFNSQSGVNITPKMGLFLLLTGVVFTLFGVTLTLKVQKKFWLQDNSFLGVILTPQYLGSFLLLKKSSSFLELK